ncbi:MAG: DUF1549 domain-containing protein [Pirellulaceae bacterium]
MTDLSLVVRLFRAIGTHFVPCLLVSILLSPVAVQAGDHYGDLVREDNPVAWWRMDALSSGPTIRNAVSPEQGSLAGELVGGVLPGQEGPDSKYFPDFPETSRAARFDGREASIRVSDDGLSPDLKFSNGEEITLEAWVRPQALNSMAYVVGKGRTRLGDYGDRNQNYSLRLVRQGGLSHLSFFFCDAVADDEARENKLDGHRWTSNTGFHLDGAWHHVAVTYRFGDPDSIQGYIDGTPVDGEWDLGGPTEAPPVVDDDQLWIGASMGGRSGVFNGDLAEVAVYNKIVPEEHLRRRYRASGVRPASRSVGRIDPKDIPADAVRVTITDPIPASRNWNFVLTGGSSQIWETDRFAFTRVPHKYTSKGLIADRGLPYLMTAASRISVPQEESGTHELVLRALSAARLFINGELVAETPFQSLAQSGHGKLHQLKPPEPDLLSLPAAHTEKRFSIELEPGEHQVVLESIIGHPGRMPRVGELTVGIKLPGESMYRILSPTDSIAFDDTHWLDFLKQERGQIEQLNQKARINLGREEAAWWQRRHELAREHLLRTDGPQIPPVNTTTAVNNAIDHFIQYRLESEGIEPAPLVNDLGFLRRVTLDVTGTIPTPAEIQTFLADPTETRREALVDRLLDDPRWADHWVPYWQDVLAENVGLAKPTLNNTGPFRFFIHSSFEDNKPIDRFATELILMEGSKFLGGPAGFGVATQNDVPMAAKAHILGNAFLGVEMKCARCHDSPMHEVTQKDLFSLAAMLSGKEIKVPHTSSIPGTPEELGNMLVEVTLEPGTAVAPAWPFGELNSMSFESLPAELVRRPQDHREQLALWVTWAENKRFASVVANRVWKRYLGRGLAEPVHDFEYASISHPDLLDYLARQLVGHDYDLKHLARIILNSQAYQRLPAEPQTDAASHTKRFAAATERRLTAEQVFDSLHVATGKEIDSEEMTLDRDGRQRIEAFVSLGQPVRAWEMAATSNERDRPSTIWPKAQGIVDLLAAFGWRQSRPDPITDREAVTTPLMPMMLAHGPAANHVIDLSDRSGITELALEEQSVERLIERLYFRVLTRPPSSREQELFVDLLSAGYAERIVAGPEAIAKPVIPRSARSWSNNLRPDANEAALEDQERALAGDPPTRRLDSDWRIRMEEAVWTLVNLPEFAFAP